MRHQTKKNETDGTQNASAGKGRLDGYKELTPIVYGQDAIKYLFCQTTEAGKLLFEMHWHERMEILRIVSGSLELQLGETQLTLQAGEAAVLNPRMLHCGHAGAGGVVYHTIMFDVDRLCNGTNVSEKYLLPLCRCEVGFRPMITEKEIIGQIDRLIACVHTKNPLMALGIVYEILGFLYLDALAQTDEKQRNSREFGEVLEYIDRHYCEKLSARLLSEYFSYNETYFCRRFKELTGMTVMKYIQALRMEEAQRLLEGGNEAISVIARKCGFSDACYFSNCFRKHFGYTPTKFRSLQEK